MREITTFLAHELFVHHAISNKAFIVISASLTWSKAVGRLSVCYWGLLVWLIRFLLVLLALSANQTTV